MPKDIWNKVPVLLGFRKGRDLYAQGGLTVYNFLP